MHPFLLAGRTGLFVESRFMGKVLDEWITDTQEFLHSKLPHLIVAAIIAFGLYRLLILDYREDDSDCRGARCSAQSRGPG